VRHFDLDYCEDRIVYVAGMSKSFSSYAAFVTCFDEKMKYHCNRAGPSVSQAPATASLASALAGLRVNTREGDAPAVHLPPHPALVTAVKAIGFEVDNGGFFPIVGVVIAASRNVSESLPIAVGHDIVITPAIIRRSR